MHFRTLNRITHLPVWAHAAAAISATAFFQWAKRKLDASYAASLHPVDYATGQTTFNGAQIKDYYASMQKTGTLDVYVTTQLVDFGFIAAVACMGLFFCTFIARFGRDTGLGRRIGLFAGLSLIIAATCDAIENGISFIMLANPTGFANWLALPYSAFASIKFALITLGMLLVLVALLCVIAGRLFNMPRIG